MVNETNGYKFNYTLKELAINEIAKQEKEKKSVADYKQILTELNIMNFE